MSVSLPNGSIISIANGYGLPVKMTNITNANPGVATLEDASGIMAGDYLEVTSGWSRLTNKVTKAGVVSSDTVALSGINTTITSIFTPGGGLGSVRRITGWTQIPQILSTGSTGGEQQFYQFQFLEDDAQKQIPTVKSAGGLTISVAYDPTLPGFMLASEANNDRLPRAVLIRLPSGDELLYNAYISMNETPSLTVNEAMANEMTLSLLAAPVRYAHA